MLLLIEKKTVNITASVYAQENNRAKWGFASRKKRKRVQCGMKREREGNSRGAADNKKKRQNRILLTILSRKPSPY